MKIVYKLGKKSLILARTGGYTHLRAMEVEEDRLTAYDLSRFNKIVFYLKGKKEKTFFSKPNKILVTFACFDQKIESHWGKWIDYYNKTEIIPDKKWKKIEIPFNDLVPSARASRWFPNYPSQTNLHNVLSMWFMFSSFKSLDGFTGSNTVWIDEIMLE